jgi:hypothetical protein
LSSDEAALGEGLCAKHLVNFAAALRPRPVLPRDSSGCLRPRVERNEIQPRSMGYISPIHMQRQKISGSMWTKTLRSTLVSEARNYVGSLHEHSLRPAERTSEPWMVSYPACEATVAPLMFNLKWSIASLHKPRTTKRSPRQMGSRSHTVLQPLEHQPCNIGLATSDSACSSC